MTHRGFASSASAEPSTARSCRWSRRTGSSLHGLEWARLAVDAATTEERRILAELFAGVHRAHSGDVETALTQLAGAVEHSRGIGGWLLGFAHLVTAQAGRLTGHVDDVRDHAESAIALLHDRSVDWGRAQAIDVVIDAIDPDTDPALARRLATEGLALCRSRDFPELEGRMLLQLGVATHAQETRSSHAATSTRPSRSPPRLRPARALGSRRWSPAPTPASAVS